MLINVALIKTNMSNENNVRLTEDEEKAFRALDQIESEGAVEDCFVATAVYGDKNAPQVQTLRQFKDEILMQNEMGRAFVSFYYSGAGKKTANFVREHLPSTLPLIRKGLDCLVDRYSAQKKH